MLLCNEYGTAFKDVSDSASIEHLENAGWREVEEPSRRFADKNDVPKFVKHRADSLMYKGLKLSWYVQAGTVVQLREALTFAGVPFNPSAKKKELIELLRSHIKEVKARLKSNDRE